MNNPNAIVQAKHLDSLAASFSGALSNTGGSPVASSGVVLSTSSSTVEGAMWFEVSGDAPVIKFMRDGKEFTFSQNSTPVTAATFSDGTVTIGDKTFTLIGFRSDLAIFDGKFYTTADTNHQNPLGDITACFNGGIAQRFVFTFNSIDAVDSTLTLGATVTVRQTAGANCDYSLNFAQGGVPSPVSIEWHEWTDADEDDAAVYYVRLRGQAYVQRTSADANTYVYTPALGSNDDDDTVFESRDEEYILRFISGAVSGTLDNSDPSYPETVGSFSSTAPFELKLYNLDGDEIKLDGNNFPYVYDTSGNVIPNAHTGINSIELVITSASAFVGGTTSLTAAINGIDSSRIKLHLEGTGWTGDPNKPDKIKSKVTFAGSGFTIADDKFDTFERAATADAYIYAFSTHTKGFYHVDCFGYEHYWLRYNTQDYIGDYFTITGLVGGLYIGKQHPRYDNDYELRLGNSVVGWVHIASYYIGFNIIDISAIDTAKIGDGGKIVLTNTHTLNVTKRYGTLSFNIDTRKKYLTNYTLRDGYNPNATFEDLDGGSYKYTSPTIPEYVESPVVTGSGATAVYTATYHAAKSSSFTVSGLNSDYSYSVASVSGGGYNFIATKNNSSVVAGSITFNGSAGLFTITDSAVIAGGNSQAVTLVDSDANDSMNYSLAFDLS